MTIFITLCQMITQTFVAKTVQKLSSCPIADWHYEIFTISLENSRLNNQLKIVNNHDK